MSVGKITLHRGCGGVVAHDRQPVVGYTPGATLDRHEQILGQPNQHLAIGCCGVDRQLTVTLHHLQSWMHLGAAGHHQREHLLDGAANGGRGGHHPRRHRDDPRPAFREA